MRNQHQTLLAFGAARRAVALPKWNSSATVTKQLS
jgi:hypothetical protein